MWHPVQTMVTRGSRTPEKAGLAAIRCSSTCFCRHWVICGAPWFTTCMLKFKNTHEMCCVKVVFYFVNASFVLVLFVLVYPSIKQASKNCASSGVDMTRTLESRTQIISTKAPTAPSYYAVEA